MKTENVYDLITSEESAYQTTMNPVVEGWEWNMWEHIKLTILYKNTQLSTGKDDNKPVKNITLPILRLQYRAEGFDVKDIVLYADSPKEYWKSFLIKKFHDKWARDNHIDTFIDEMVESYVDFGGALVKNINKVRPEVVPLQRLAFVDQTDIMSGPICEKHFYSVDQLKDMEKQGWGNESNGATGTVDDVIVLSESEKEQTQMIGGKKVQTPSKYIKVYELHGIFPKWWLGDKYETGSYDEKAPENEYIRQIHIITFYTDESGNSQGICLFKGKERELPYKLVLRDKIYGRALGLGGAEELFEPQVWTTYDLIRIKGLLDAAAKVLYQTTDKTFSTRNKTDGLDNGEILVTAPNTNLVQINTTPVNIALFERSLAEWEAHAQQLGGANDAILGESPTAGTPFKLQELVVQQSQALHEYRKGQLATFLAEIYDEWIIPYISREIPKGQEFLSELELDELQFVADALVINQSNKLIKEQILSGEEVKPEIIESYKQIVRDEFMKGGNKKFIEIFEGEFKSVPMSVDVNIAGKQKDLSAYTDKLVNIFRQLIAAPGILDDPRMAKIFNQILEASGLSPIDFYQKPPPQEQMVAQPMAQKPIVQQPMANMNQPVI